MGREIDIDVARERDDERLLDEWNGDKPKYPVRRKIDSDCEQDREERGDDGRS